MTVNNRIVSMPNQTRSYSGFSDQQPSADSERSAFRSNAIHDAATLVSNHALSTARIIIGAEELLRQRFRSVLRVVVATVFFAISGLISIGANVTTAFAKKVSSHRGLHGQTTRLKRSVKHRPASARFG